MNKVTLNKIMNVVRCLAASVMVIFVLFLSCPVKHGIKVLAGIPVNTGSSSAKQAGHLYVTNGTAQCAGSEAIDTETLQASLIHTNCTRPAAFFTAIFSLNPDHLPYKHQRLFCRSNTTTVQPVYLAHQQLLI